MFDTTQWDPALAAGDPIAMMRANLAAASSEELEHWNADSLSTRLVDLIELRERLDAELTRVTAAWHNKRSWETNGSHSPVAWLTHRAPIAAPDAKHLIKTARVINQSPQLAEALAAGATTAAHVGALARVMSPRRAPLLAEHEEVLTKQAERLSTADFTTLVRRWATLADDHLTTDSHNEHQSRKELHPAVTMDGWLDGTFRFNPIADARFLATLNHLAPPDPANAPDGARTLAQRRGDLEGIGPVTQTTLEDIACGAALRRLVTAGDSIILDMGHKTRLATASQTRATRIRDTGCIFPSCDRPAHWCDIHHIKPYAQSGDTTIENMACLCRRHHALIHNTKWTITTSGDGAFNVTHPTRAP